MNKSKLKFLWALVVITISGSAYQAAALPNVGIVRKPTAPTSGGQLKGTAALCDPATATVDLDINNVRARMMNGGDMWWDRATGTARYEVPKGSGKHSLYSGSVWVGGYDAERNLKVCAQTYRQNGNDYWPGPLDVVTNSIDKATCSEWDKIWRINKSDLFDFREAIKNGQRAEDLKNEPRFQDIVKWPALGNVLAEGKSNLPLTTLTQAVGVPNHTYAPFKDNNGDGIYNPNDGDYPDILGDQYTWWVFNDVGNTKTETGSIAIGMEVQTSAFAFSRKDYMNDATFINYRLINRGVLTMTETYMATWTDADLGYGYDDYIGCDTVRGLGILYNAKVPDGNGEVTSYGNQVPMVGVDFFIGPKHDTFIVQNGIAQYKILDTLDMTIFNYFNNSNTSRTGNPSGALEFFRVMTGKNRVGDLMVDDRSAGASSSAYTPGGGPFVKFAYPGNPTNAAEWSQCQCGLPKTEDRRFVHSSGPFTLYSGGTTNDLTIGMVWVADVGGCPNATFARIRAADDLAQEFFDVRFRVIRGPDAPDMTIREGDRELIFYLTNNNPYSNNYHEKYGRDTAEQFRESAGSLARKTPDSLYKFEGYRVFQLKNSTVTAAQIFGDNGEINNDMAVEVFQCDVQNGITRIINHENRPEIGPNAFQDQIKVTGKDSGIIHSFRLTQDAFAVGNDSRFVNYHNYYFLAVAYAHNDYRTFSYLLADSTQKRPYLESSQSWAPGARLALLPQSGMPNPTNGAMGTETPAVYGSGVVIKRMEGEGNGRTFAQLDETSEEAALQGPDYRIAQPVYESGRGPIDIKVVDPRKVKAFDWEIWLNGQLSTVANRGLIGNLSSWKLIRKNEKDQNIDTIYSDQTLDIINEQIVADYGLSIKLNQVARPGDDQLNNNGYISSSATFADITKPWLAGVNDDEFATPRNWIRSGHNREQDTTLRCGYNDKDLDTAGQFYESLLSGSSALKGTWAPYALAAVEPRGTCGFGVAYNESGTLADLPSIDVVFTSDKSKWSRCVVVDLQDDKTLSEGGVSAFDLRAHAGWNKDVRADGRPVYSSDPADSGFSWFPGYAINPITGKRVNIFFGEDSYLKVHNGNDMIWNPTSTISGRQPSEIINGGKHYVYVTDSAYDGCKTFAASLRIAKQSGINIPKANAYRTVKWVGLPTLGVGQNLLSISDGLIPTETKLRFRVQVPFRMSIPDPNLTLLNNGLPRYFFTTRDIAVRPLGSSNNTADKNKLLEGIRVVPNPYYGYSGYEQNRLDNRVRITNLPNRATISIYSIDGTLIRRLEHVNSAETTRGYEDWDIRNTKGLQIASGMYLIHVKAEGIGETVVKWFGAMKPADVTDF